MTVKSQINSTQTGIEIQFFGKVTGKEIISINKELSENMDYIFQVWGFLEATSIEYSMEEIHQIALQDRNHSLTSKLHKVAIVGSKDILRGVDEMYEHFSNVWVGRPNHFISRTFATMNEANKWVYSIEES